MFLAIIGATGRLGGATLSALLEHNLFPAQSLVCLTSSQPASAKWVALSKTSPDLTIRHATFDDPRSLETALKGCDRFLLVSSPRVALEFGEDFPEEGRGREGDHYVAIEAARRAGVRHLYYTSLAFKGDPSRSFVMRAHERTERYLKGLKGADEGGMDVTVVREGLYNEFWTQYLGMYDVAGDGREEIVVAGEGVVSWTAIEDLGLATALVVAADPKEYAGRTFYLSNAGGAKSLEEVAQMVSEVVGRQLRLKVIGREEYEDYYIKDRGLPEGRVKWWARSFDALREGECHVEDPTLTDLLRRKGRSPKPVAETIRQMLGDK